MTQGSGDRLEQSTEAAVPFPHLYSPLELRGRVLRNRIVSTPHATGWGRDGLIDPREVDYHVRKAAGGCALVMTFGSASVEPTSAASYGSIALWDERNEPALRALADGVHARGALCRSQMTHMGRRGTSTLTGIPLRAPSDLPEGVHLEVPVPLAVSEIPAIVQRFADAAARLERCGWDGCEVTSFGGHLIEQFFDPRVNARTDEYGGSLENRTRFGREVLEAVRAAVSDDFLVGFRMALDQCLTGGLGPDELIEVGRSFAATGAIDLFSVSGGTGATRLSTAYFVPGDELPEGVFNERARRFREAVGQAGVREQLEHQAPVGRQGGQERPELTMVRACFSCAGARPVPSPSGTMTRTPAAGLSRITPSSLASPRSARRTATCRRTVDFDSRRPLRGSRCSTSQRTKALTSRGWISVSRSRRTPSK
jgi:2,4-dienoyl-CoA reductase-like NADH-dependent reductase (Old Yellow Enzyme family)